MSQGSKCSPSAEDRVTNSVRASFTEEVTQAGHWMLNWTKVYWCGGGGERHFNHKDNMDKIQRWERANHAGKWGGVLCLTIKGSGRKPGCKLGQGQIVVGLKSKKFGVDLEGTREPSRVLTKEQWLMTWFDLGFRKTSLATLGRIVMNRSLGCWPLGRVHRGEADVWTQREQQNWTDWGAI